MFEIIMVAFLLLVVPALAIILPNKNDPGLSYYNMPGEQDGILDDDERNELINFSGFLEDKLNVEFRDHKSIEAKIDLRPTYYNVSPGNKGVLKRNGGKRWVFYEIGDKYKKVEETKEFDSQIAAYKYLASKFELEYTPRKITTIKNSFEI